MPHQQRRTQFALLTAHFGLFVLSGNIAGGFIGAYLLKLGFTVPEALCAYSALLAGRLVSRFGALAVIRRIGARRCVGLGAAVCALQFVPLAYADRPWGLVAWMLVVALGESLYFPVYHAAVAVISSPGRRGRELGTRQVVSALSAVLGPLAGAALLVAAGPSANFAVAGVICALGVAPVLWMKNFDVGTVPTVAQSFRGADLIGVLAFTADGWLTAGWSIAWSLVLFLSVGKGYGTLGLLNAGAGLVGLLTGLACGHGIDRGHRGRLLAGISVAMAAGLVFRAASAWSPLAAEIANLTGAAVSGIYTPVLMSVIYDRAKRSGEPLKFHFAAEGGWDTGGAAGCLAAAAVAWLQPVQSLCVLPSALGIGAMYLLVRAGGRNPAERDIG